MVRASRNMLCLMNQYILSPYWWIWESNTCHLEIIDTSYRSTCIPLMKFWSLIWEQGERDVLHGSNIVLWTFILVINKWVLRVESGKGNSVMKFHRIIMIISLMMVKSRFQCMPFLGTPAPMPPMLVDSRLATSVPLSRPEVGQAVGINVLASFGRIWTGV